MKFLAIAWFLGSVGPVLQPPDPPITNHEQLIERIEQKYIENDKLIAMGAGGPFKRAVVDWVTPEYRPVVIEYLKEKAKDPKYLERAQRVLIALDDDETVSHAIHQFNDGSLNPASILCQNLKVDRIKDLIPIVSEGSETPRTVDIGKLRSPRYHAIDFSLSLIEGSGMFSHEEREWASGLWSNSYNDGPGPQIMCFGSIQ